MKFRNLKRELSQWENGELLKAFKMEKLAFCAPAEQPLGYTSRVGGDSVDAMVN